VAPHHLTYIADSLVAARRVQGTCTDRSGHNGPYFGPRHTYPFTVSHSRWALHATSFPTKSECKLPCSRFNGSISPANWPRGHSHPLGGSWSASPSELTEASPHRYLQGFGSGIRVIDFSPSSFSSSSTSPTALQRYTFPKCPELWGAKHGRDRQAVLASELVLGWYSCPRLRSLLRLEPPSAAVLGYSCPRLHDHPYLICRGV